MRTGRSYIATAVALGLLTLSGCAADAGSVSGSKNIPTSEDWGNPDKYPEIGGAYASLVALATAPTYDTPTAAMTVTVAASETAMIGLRATDSAVLVNGVASKDSTGAVVTAKTIKRIVVTSPAAGTTEIVIIDYLGGLFATGAKDASTTGISVTLADATDELRIRGTLAADTVYMSDTAISFNTDNFPDITYAGAGVASIALASGDDTFVGTNTVSTKGILGTAAIPLKLYGGAGKDTITGGDNSDVIYGGAGDDTLFGAGNGTKPGGAANSEVDKLNGEDGADTLLQGADKDGPDVFVCGSEVTPDPLKPVKDTVSYAKRGTAAVRNESVDLPTILASDGERVSVIIGDGVCVDTVAPVASVVGTELAKCDGDADGFPDYTTDGNGNRDGQLVESGGTWTVAGILDSGSTTLTTDSLDSTNTGAEGDMVASDCEIVMTGSDNDIVTGDANGNTLYGGAGDDTLTGKAGDDTLNGEAGDDTFAEESASNGADVFNGGDGTDLVDYHSRTLKVTVTMDGKDANDGDVVGGGEKDNVKGDVENLKGSSVGDDITGNPLNNRLWGMDGDDLLNGSTGNDVFDEGTAANGADTFTGGTGIDMVYYGTRTAAVTVTMVDEATGNDGDGAANSGAGEKDNVKGDVEDLVGGDGVDSLTGNTLDNHINGGKGIDTLISGGAGNDTLDGDADSTGADGAVTIDCGADADLGTGGGTGAVYIGCEV